MLWGVVCLMMVPYPELVEQAGGRFGRVLAVTGALTVVAGVAGVAIWLLVRGHVFKWAGQLALAAALIVLVWFAWSSI